MKYYDFQKEIPHALYDYILARFSLNFNLLLQIKFLLSKNGEIEKKLSILP